MNTPNTTRKTGPGGKNAINSPPQSNPSDTGSFGIRPDVASALMLACLLGLLERQNALGSACPDNAISATAGVTFTAYKSDGVTPIQPDFGVGACETVLIRMNLAHVPFDSQGNIVAAFSGGTMLVVLPNGSITDVTPVGGVPRIGPIPSTCTPPAVTNNLSSRFAQYAITPADVAAGFISFTGVYTNVIGHLGSDVPLGGFSSGMWIRVNPAPACALNPPTNSASIGSTASFTVTPTGVGPFTFHWTGPGGFNSTSQTITITNVQPGDVGLYSATVTDRYACSTSGQASLTTDPTPILGIKLSEVLTLCGAPGVTYRLEYADSLESPAIWRTWMSVVLTDGNVVIPVPDTEGINKRFYRAVLIP